MTLEQDLSGAIEEVVISHLAAAGRYRNDFPSRDYFKEAHSAIVDEVFRKKLIGLPNLKSIPLTPGIFPELEEQGTIDTIETAVRDISSKFFMRGETEITSLDLSVLLTGINIPLKVDTRFASSVGTTLYFKPINTKKRTVTGERLPEEPTNSYLKRVVGMELYNLLSGFGDLEFFFREGYQVEREVEGEHLTRFDIPSEQRENYILGRSRLLFLANLLGIYDIFTYKNDNSGDMEFKELNVMTKIEDSHSTIIDFDNLGPFADEMITTRREGFQRAFGITDDQYETMMGSFGKFVEHNYLMNQEEIDSLVQDMREVLRPAQEIFETAKKNRDWESFQHLGPHISGMCNFTNYINRTLALLKEGDYVI